MLFLFLQGQNQSPSILSFAVVAALVSAVASFLALVVKDYFFARSFESWKSNRTLDEVYRKYRDPIILASKELCSILDQICSEYPPKFLDSEILNLTPTQQLANSADDEYYLKYKLTTTVYRFCSFFAWLELYRRDIVFLNSGHDDLNRRLDSCILNIRDDIAQGGLNEANDWHNWTDILVFREEQRAIGEMMIVTDDKTKVVMGYGKFSALFNSSSKSDQSPWIQVATSFFLDPKNKKDFRLIRIKRMIVHLVELIELLDKSEVPAQMEKWRSKYKSDVQ